jgi:hypothetical protein
MTLRMPSFCVAVQAAPVVVMSATVVMPLESASRPPRMAESYQSLTSIFVLFSSIDVIHVV